MMNKIDESLKLVRQTSCETEAIKTVESYIGWLENIFLWNYQNYYKGYSSEMFRKEWTENCTYG